MKLLPIADINNLDPYSLLLLTILVLCNHFAELLEKEVMIIDVQLNNDIFILPQVNLMKSHGDIL